MNKEPQIDRLLKIMKSLRDPERGCPWDKAQTFQTIAPYTIEEAYEVADAIKKNDHELLKEELGDLLLQIVFYAQMSEELGGFTFEDIAGSISDKMVKRHRQILENNKKISLSQQMLNWENQKALERNSNNKETGALEGVALALPALMRAQKLQNRAARVGFDWKNIEPVFEKVSEELNEVKGALTNPKNLDHIAEEIGDLLFSCVNLARHIKVDAEQALKTGNEKFERRFTGVEIALHAEGKLFEECSLEELEKYWETVKSEEKT